MHLSVPHILSVRELTAKDVELILATAASLREISDRPIKKVPALRGKTVINCFFEASTRTRMSFEVAAKRLSADVYNFAAGGSSLSKGETILDTVKTLHAMHPDMLVIRHNVSGTPALIAREVPGITVLNAGDGINEHPTQALLDLFTITEKRGPVKGMTILMVGDIAHSRVARSNIWLLTKMGARVTLVAPKTFLPPDLAEFKVAVSHNLSDAVRDADIIMMLRIQMERGSGCYFPNVREYATYFGLTKRVLRASRKDPLIMHPGPVNRGVEIDPEIADGKTSLILDQVENGVAIRMALLYLLGGGTHHE